MPTFMKRNIILNMLLIVRNRKLLTLFERLKDLSTRRGNLNIMQLLSEQIL